MYFEHQFDRGESMRTFRLLTVLLLLVSFATAQQKDAPKKVPDKKPAATQKTEEATQPHPEDTRAVESQANAPASPSVLAPATPNTKFDMKEVAPIVTHHSIKAASGKTLQYTATTGRMPIKDAVGNIEAEMFYVAYTLDGQEPGRRPVSFAFNGGTGSASIWLHMGALGPRKVVLQPDGWMP